MTETDRKNPAMNALKHGILAAAVVVHTGLAEHANESREEFQAILAELVVYYAPQGPIEAMLCEKIALAYWRLRRVLWFEGGQIAAGITSGTKEALKETESMEDAAAEFQERADAVLRAGRLTGEELGAARQYFGRKRVTVEEWADMLRMWATGSGREAEAHFNRKTQHSAAPDFGDQRWDMAMRYEAHLNRQLHKDIKMLADHQAVRRPAHPVPGRKPRRGAGRAHPEFLHVVKR